MESKLKTAAGAFERLMLPRLNSIDGELKAINAKIDTKIDATNTRIDALNTKLDSTITSLNVRIDNVEKGQVSLKNELLAVMKGGFAEQNAKIDRLAATVESMARELDTQREIAILKTKVAELEKRKT